jgi:hypothetical protein
MDAWRPMMTLDARDGGAMGAVRTMRGRDDARGRRERRARGDARERNDDDDDDDDEFGRVRRAVSAGEGKSDAREGRDGTRGEVVARQRGGDAARGRRERRRLERTAVGRRRRREDGDGERGGRRGRRV